MDNPETIAKSYNFGELSYRIHKTRTEKKRYVFYLLVHVQIQVK
jgi:hypothetical protein